MEKHRLDVIPGYEHPVKSNYSKQGIYKTFTEGKKYKKSEFGTITVGKQYKQGDTDTIEIENCPLCDESAIKICQCGYSDKTCKNNHVWYTDRDGSIIKKDPHK